MSIVTILVIAVIALIIMLAFSASGNTTKRTAIKEKDDTIKHLYDKLDRVVAERHHMEVRFRNLERELPNSLYAVDDKGEEVNYYRIKTMDKDDEFDGYNIGDKVPHIRRKVKYVWKNVPITLKLKRK